ncbi:MAG: serine hydrolase, partial [Acidobacteria bacterium]|nr:serine hydrolase [Acidobacteriota bacterium]
MHADFQSRLEARVARLQDDTGLTGVAVAVMTDGQLVGAAASGERRRGSGIPVSVDDRWHVGSITKSMTATLLAVLEGEGRL